MDELEIMEPAAAVGDLVFCHACGDSHGWVINQLGIVKEVSVYKDCGGPDEIRLYRVWLFNMKHTEVVKDRDFEIKNVELISRASGDNEDLKDIMPRWKKSLEELMKDNKRLIEEVHYDKKMKKMPFS